jgi:hypothetical protein
MAHRPLTRSRTKARIATVAVSFAIFAVVVVLTGPVTVLSIDPEGVLVAVVSDLFSDGGTGGGAWFLYIILPPVGVLLGAIAGARRDPFGGWLASLAGVVLAGAVLGLVSRRYFPPDPAWASPSVVAYALNGAVVMAQDYLLLCTLPFAIAAAIAWVIVRQSQA